MTRGLVVGKFYPPHLGHEYLINYALDHCDHLDIFVIHLPDQWIPGHMRVDWVQKRFLQALVHSVLDLGEDDNSELWAQHTIERLGMAPDVVFTSEDYGERYAHFMGCKHISVDPQRTRIPISATQIRQDPLAHWSHIGPGPRAFLALRVVLIGAESTGKTVLAERLSQHYATSWVPEYGRDYWAQKLANGEATLESNQWHSDEFLHIAHKQAQHEDAQAGQCSGLLICDTDPLATAVWHERYLAFSSRSLVEFARPRMPHLYLFLRCDVPFTQDGTRDGEHVRQDMDRRFSVVLRKIGAPLVEVTGSWSSRFEQATNAIDALLHSPYRLRQLAKGDYPFL